MSPWKLLSPGDGSGENYDGTSRNNHLLETTTWPATYGCPFDASPSVAAVNWHVDVCPPP